MFVIMVYDVGQRRVAKVLKTGRRYLNWVQNSVLEGELSVALLEKLKMELRNVIDHDGDSVIFYTWRSERYTSRDVLGIEKNEIAMIV